jgi:hypothetical protein
MEAGIRSQESALEPKTENLKPKTDLLEALAWLDYCLGEAEAAAQAVKAIGPQVTNLGHRGMDKGYYALCEMVAHITTIRGRWARWGKDGF